MASGIWSHWAMAFGTREIVTAASTLCPSPNFCHTHKPALMLGGSCPTGPPEKFCVLKGASPQAPDPVAHQVLWGRSRRGEAYLLLGRGPASGWLRQMTSQSSQAPVPSDLPSLICPSPSPPSPMTSCDDGSAKTSKHPPSKECGHRNFLCSLKRVLKFMLAAPNLPKFE